MRIAVATHGHCVDGLVSAALFSFLVRRVENPGVAFTYHACAYGPNQTAPGSQILDGDQNAILDFRYWDDARVTWYFDHHPTAFTNAAERQAFESRRASHRYHYDPRADSAARLIAEVGHKSFGVDMSAFAPLVDFADRVDTARFDSAEAALDRSTPEGRLVAVIERFGDSAWLTRYVPELTRHSLAELGTHPDMVEQFARLAEEQRDFVDHVRRRADARGPVVVVDLTDRIHPTLSKFVVYSLFPRTLYSVVLGAIPGAVRISVGYNPWSGLPRRHDLGALCQERGGGGHPVVGGVAYPPSELEKARAVALELGAILGGTSGGA